MKNIFLVLLFSATFTSVNAQTKGRHATSGSTTSSGFSIGLEAGLPVGENGEIYSHLIGGSLQYEFMPAHDLGITANAGYLNYNIKSKYGGGSVGFVPLLAGVKYYFTPGAFFHAQLGAAIGTKTGQGTSFAYTPGLGIKLSPKIDAEVKYMGISNKGGTLPNVGIRAAYNF